MFTFKQTLLILLLYVSILESGSHRLDNSFKPTDYNLQLTLTHNFTNDKKLSGSVIISGIVKQDNIKIIKFYAANDISIIKILINDGTIYSANWTYDKPTEMLEIATRELKKEDLVTISIDYKGILYEDMNGFYLSSVYQNETIATTQFRPTYARRAFPCFDEPIFKAYFTVSVTVPNDYKVISNQPGIMLDLPDKMKRFQFAKTPWMSAYLLAFVVCQYDSKTIEGTLLPNGMRIWAPESSMKSTEFASEVSYPILEILSNQLNNVGPDSVNIAFDQMSLLQLDQVAIPDFATGATENWGLVTYKQNKLLWTNGESPLKAKETVARVITHQFTHNWFGNWVTTKWWNTIWLNEAFAKYFEYYGLKGVSAMDDYQLEKQFLVEEMFPIMESDAGDQELSLSSTAESLSEINQKFGSITYSKGGSIVRMLRHIVGDNFMKHLNRYLGTFMNKAVEPTDLFRQFPENVNKTTIEQIMTNWVTKPGYPVVHVFTDRITNNQTIVTLTQRPFAYQTLNTSTEWYIPVWYTNYILSSGKVEHSSIYLLKPGTHLTLTLPNDRNIITLINPQRFGYYRVNYDQRMWDTIINMLKTNHKNLDSTIKANLIDDALNLARAGHLSYRTAFNLLQFMKEETEYLSWKTTINAFTYLQQRFQNDDDLWKKLSKQINTLMLKLWEVYRGFHIDPNLNPIQVYTKILLMEWRCLLGNNDCINDANNLWNNSVITRAKPIDANLRGVVYCSVLRSSEYSTDEIKKWNVLWDIYLKTKDANARDVILTALGCTENEEIIDKYLNYSLNKEFIRLHDINNVFKAILDGSVRNIYPIIQFLDANIETIPRHSFSKIISDVGEKLTNDDDLNQFTKFITKHHKNLKEYAEIIDAAIKTANNNINWSANNKETLISYLSSGLRNGIDVLSLLITLTMVISNYFRY